MEKNKPKNNYWYSVSFLIGCFLIYVAISRTPDQIVDRDPIRYWQFVLGCVGILWSILMTFPVTMENLKINQDVKAFCTIAAFIMVGVLVDRIDTLREVLIIAIAVVATGLMWMLKIY